MTDEELIRAARRAADRAYCPYSKFRVGCAVECPQGGFVTGCNVENASYGLTVCAERCALFALAALGHRTFRRLAVSCPGCVPEDPAGYRMPCGACRQVMAEFAGPDSRILVDGVGTFMLEDLLPTPFVLG